MMVGISNDSKIRKDYRALRERSLKQNAAKANTVQNLQRPKLKNTTNLFKEGFAFIFAGSQCRGFAGFGLS